MFTLFVVCFLVGVGVSAVSLIAGFAHFHHHGGLHFHQHHGGGQLHQGGGHHGGEGFLTRTGSIVGQLFNFAALTMFLTWFGGVGLLLQQTTRLVVALDAVVAGVAGIIGASAMNRIIGALRAQERPLQPISIVGKVGKLTIPIREGGTGEVIYEVDGKRRCSGARSDDGKPMPKGAEVVILNYDKGIAYVCGLDAIADGGPQQIARQ